MENQEGSGQIVIKSYDSDSSFIVNLLYFLVWIPLKYAIVFGLVYSAWPLYKRLSKMLSPMKSLANGIKKQGSKILRGGFFSRLLGFVIALCMLAALLLMSIIFLFFASFFGVIVYLISLIINL